MHFFRVVAFHEVGSPAAAPQELLQFFAFYAGQNGGVGYFIAVKMKYRKDSSIGYWAQEFVGVPGGRQRPGFRFTVADNTGYDQIGIIERRAEGMA